ncbi:MAG: inorganic diphosphatase [Candidatus Paceibacterota bacterium]|jgi:inorganic pyrophosphatase
MDTKPKSSNIVSAKDFLGKVVQVTIDRPLNSKHHKFGWEYKLNYGFIPDTMSADGEELDAYVMGSDEPIATFKGKCIAVVHRTNDDDDKLIVVPEEMEFTDEQIVSATNFQEQYFKSVILR